jgi:predicted PurR-regulated permease PerM
MSFPPPSPRQARIIWVALTGLALAAIVALVVGLIWGTGRVLNILSPVLWPLAVAGVLAYLLDPVVDWLRKWMSRRTAILTVFAVALVLLGILLASVIPQLVRETRDLAERIPGYVQRSQKKIEAYLQDPPSWAERWLKSDKPAQPAQPDGSVVASNAPPAETQADTNTTPSAPPPATAPVVHAPPAGSKTNTLGSLAAQIDSQTLQSAGNWAAGAVPKIGRWLLGQLGRVAGWFGALVALALIPIYTFYLLAEKRGIQSHWTNYLPIANSKFKDEVVFVIDSANTYMIAFFRGQVLVAICDGIMYSIGFLIIGLPYAVLLGVVAVFLTLIPFLGAIVTCAVALLLALVQFGDWLHPLLVLVVFAVVQTIEGFVVAPKILGDKVGLHPLTIIIAVMAGTTLMGGILGGILAIPLTALLRVVLARYVWKREIPSTSG